MYEDVPTNYIVTHFYLTICIIILERILAEVLVKPEQSTFFHSHL